MKFSCLPASAPSWLAAASFSLLGLSALPAPAQADPINLVQNGNFLQTSTASPGGFLCANSGGSACTSQLTSWSATCSNGGCVGTASPSSILYAGTDGRAWNGGFGLYWNGIGDAPLGGNAVGIDGDPNYTSVLSQSISGLKLGETYMLQFYQAASQQVGLSGATTEQWKVSLGGGIAQTSTLMNTPSQGASGWQQITMTFVANAANEVLQFVALGTPAGEPPVALLGDVALTDVPEPATLALAGAGLVGLVLARKRRKEAVLC